jgi:hypothetical protein
VIKRVASPGQSSGPTLHRNTFILALLAFAELGQMVDVEINVIRNEEV